LIAVKASEFEKAKMLQKQEYFASYIGIADFEVVFFYY
jgi:hypothetical protein